MDSLSGGGGALLKLGRTRHVACEARFEAKTSEESRTGGGSRRDVFGDGGRRIRRNRTPNSESAVATHPVESRDYSRRGGNLRRQLGNVLCF